LKYYHPAVADHNIDWDSAFIKYYDKVKSVSSKQEFNAVLLAMYMEAEDKQDSINHRSLSIAEYSNYMTGRVPSFMWYLDDNFTVEVSNILEKVRRDFKPQNNYYLSSDPMDFANGKGYTGDSLWYKATVFPSEPFRLLALSRYWNIIEYFYPYRVLRSETGISTHWDSVLKVYIPRVASSNDTAYHLTMVELCNEIVDSHSATQTPLFSEYFGTGFLPIQCSYIEGKTVIIGTLPPSPTETDSLLARLSLRKGDIILKIDGVQTDTIRSRLRKFTPHSNEAILQRNLSLFMVKGDTGRTASLTVSGGRIIRKVFLKYILSAKLATLQTNKKRDPSWKKLESNIGYINMGSLVEAQIDSAITDLFSTRALIFDLRGYPMVHAKHIMKYLVDSVVFARSTLPLIPAPGHWLELPVWYKQRSPSNGKKYNGSVIILVDEGTQSAAEYSAMMFQSVTGAKTFGSQTSGADGNVSRIYLPGRIVATFTGFGIYYPDGTPTQRVGLKIDYQVTPSIQGVREGKDEVLDAAVLHVLQNTKK
jgi:hypothetical protein